MIKKIFHLCLLILIAIPVFGQSKQQAIDAFFTALAKNQQFSGNILVIEKNKIVYEKSFGYTDYTTQSPITPGITFPIASITKILTATAILQLSEKGRLTITDPVTQYLPEFPYPAITLKHLLSHTSGLPPYNAFFDKYRKENPAKIFTNKDFIHGMLANKQPLIYQPGEKGNYDNINFIVLALVVEKVSGMDYKNYIEKNILRPAGMYNTVLFPLPEQFNTAQIKNYAVEQIAETYGLPDSTFQKIKPYLFVTDGSIKKLNINAATTDELKTHPYIRYQLANVIVNFRLQHGNYKQVEDLKKIMILTDDVYEKLKPYITLQ